MLCALKIKFLLVTVLASANYSFAADVSKYQEPTMAEKNRIQQQIQEQLKGAEQVSQDPEFLKKFLNDQGKILPRRITGTSLKYQRKVAKAVKRARHIALLPYVTDLLK